MADDPFYIGYKDEMPEPAKRSIRNFILVLLFLTLVLGILLAVTQQPFKRGTFELGKTTEVEGILTLDPVPMLQLSNGREGILLIGYGKFGADGTLKNAMADNFDRRHWYRARLSGTLIYGEGKTLMELTDKEASLLHFEDMGMASVQNRSVGEVRLKGEIIDPKCYFGVMKPGEGKPHRSCAIRCISGGIPPVFKVENEEGHRQFYLLRGEDGQPVNEMVLKYVGEPVELSGRVYELHRWAVLEMDEIFGIRPLL